MITVWNFNADLWIDHHFCNFWTFHPWQTLLICQYFLNDWAFLILIAEFANNNHATETIEVSFCYANYSYNSICTIAFTVKDEWISTVLAQEPTEFDKQPTEMPEHLRTNMVRAKVQCSRTANTCCFPLLNFKIDDTVWPNKRNIILHHPISMINTCRLSWFKITSVAFHMFLSLNYQFLWTNFRFNMYLSLTLLQTIHFLKCTIHHNHQFKWMTRQNTMLMKS